MKNTSNRYKELGRFLKSRRDKMKPQQIGLPTGARRRAPGLRREEVAQLAGIGLTWYTWLEQGRAINVSDAVLESLARVYLLTEEERRHLYALANKPYEEDEEDHQTVSDTLIGILDKLDISCCPSYIMDYRWNLIAWNRTASAVFGDFIRLPADERNIVYMMFCNDDYMELFDDWEYHAKGIVARFHAAMAKYAADPCFNGFIQDLQNKNGIFSSWWSRHDISGMSDVKKELTHPTLGKLSFEFTSLDVSDNQALKLLIHNPDDETLVQLKNGLYD